tara:strand:- start:661 stop:1248 length:588 start_codon:yes stop_codon:yes gene_type:complete
MNLINNIKKIIYNYIEDKYNNYLLENNILLIEEENIYNIVQEFYEKNIKELKKHIREKLKEQYSLENIEYQTGTVENILLDIFQDKEFGILKISDELKYLQKTNTHTISIPIINNSLNLNINIENNYIIINNVNDISINNNKYDDIYNIVNKYKFLHKINNYNLDKFNNEEKIKIIKDNILNKEEIVIDLYYVKK